VGGGVNWSAATWLLATLMQGETTSSGLDDAKTVAEIIGTLITALAVPPGESDEPERDS
jgi:hypothetical protein